MLGFIFLPIWSNIRYKCDIRKQTCPENELTCTWELPQSARKNPKCSAGLCETGWWHETSTHPAGKNAFYGAQIVFWCSYNAVWFGYLDEAGCRVTSLLKMFLPVLLLDLQGKARTQNALNKIKIKNKVKRMSVFILGQERIMHTEKQWGPACEWHQLFLSFPYITISMFVQKCLLNHNNPLWKYRTRFLWIKTCEKTFVGSKDTECWNIFLHIKAIIVHVVLPL